MSLILKMQVSLEGAYAIISQKEKNSPPGKGRLRKSQKMAKRSQKIKASSHTI